MMGGLLSRQLLPVPAFRRQRGFALFEFGVAALVFAALVGIAANRLNMVQQQAQSVAVEQLISTLRAALQLKVAHAVATGQSEQLLNVLDENPVGWLAQTPINYLGEYYSPDIEKLTIGHWYFDRGEKTLVYLLSHRNSFAFRSSILLKFKVESARLPSIPAKQALAADMRNLALIQVVDENSAGAQ